MGVVTILLAENVWQTLPTVPWETQGDEGTTCVKVLYVGLFIMKLSLRENMRIHLVGKVSTGEFSDFLLKIWDGEYPKFKGKVSIPASLGTVVMTLQDLLAMIYLDITTVTEKSMD